MDEEDAYVDVDERANGQTILNELRELGPALTPAQAPADPWEEAQRLLESDEAVELRVMAYNKGGLLVVWKGLQGFVPASQLVDFPQVTLLRDRMQALSTWTGRSVRLKAIEVNPSSSRLIFSERATLVRADDRDDLLRSLVPGDRVSGTVTNLTDFGAFVDLGGVEGLLHISEISWRRLSRPGDAVEPGQMLSLLVLDVDPVSGRVALSSKRLRPDPWIGADKRYKPNQLVRGIVNKIAQFGAFVAIEDELDGLVHITEMAEGSFLHPRDVVRTGDTLTAKVLHVDPSRMRIALTLRGVNEPADTVA
jgi:small subunit ribosomal protein S1